MQSRMLDQATADGMVLSGRDHNAANFKRLLRIGHMSEVVDLSSMSTKVVLSEQGLRNFFGESFCNSLERNGNDSMKK